MIVKGDEIQMALRTVDAAGFSVMLKPQWDRLQQWLQQTNGWPPEDWQPRVKG